VPIIDFLGHYGGKDLSSLKEEAKSSAKVVESAKPKTLEPAKPKVVESAKPKIVEQKVESKKPDLWGDTEITSTST